MKKECSNIVIMIISSIILYAIFCIRARYSTYDAQFFNEAGINFFLNGQNSGLVDNLLNFEQGFYFSSLERLIAWFVAGLLNATTGAAFLMQNIMLLLVILSATFFTTKYFEYWGSQLFRIAIICVVFGALVNNGLYVFMNSPYMLAFFIVEMWFCDFSKMKKPLYVLLLLWTIIVMTSKVIFFCFVPIAIVMLVLHLIKKQSPSIWNIGYLEDGIASKRLAIYNLTVIVAGIFELAFTVLKTYDVMFSRDYLRVRKVGILDFLNACLYGGVQQYVNFLNLNRLGMFANVVCLLLWITIIITSAMCIVRYRNDAKKVFMNFIALFCQLLIVTVVAITRVTGQPQICPTEVDWKTTYECELMTYGFMTSLAVFVTLIVVVEGIIRHLEKNRFRYFLRIIPFALAILFFRDEFSYVKDMTYGKWLVYGKYTQNDSYLVWTYNGMQMAKNCSLHGIGIEENTEIVDIADSIGGDEVIAVYGYAVGEYDSENSYINFFDDQGNLLKKKNVLAIEESKFIGACLDENEYVVNASYVVFTDSDGKAIKLTNDITLACVN